MTISRDMALILLEALSSAQSARTDAGTPPDPRFSHISREIRRAHQIAEDVFPDIGELYYGYHS